MKNKEITVGSKARVIGGYFHRFKIGEVVTMIEEVTSHYESEHEERYFCFVNEYGLKQHLQDDEDFVWLK